MESVSPITAPTVSPRETTPALTPRQQRPLVSIIDGPGGDSGAHPARASTTSVGSAPEAGASLRLRRDSSASRHSLRRHSGGGSAPEAAAAAAAERRRSTLFADADNDALNDGAGGVVAAYRNLDVGVLNLPIQLVFTPLLHDGDAFRDVMRKIIVSCGVVFTPGFAAMGAFWLYTI